MSNEDQKKGPAEIVAEAMEQSSGVFKAYGEANIQFQERKMFMVDELPSAPGGITMSTETSKFKVRPFEGVEITATNLEDAIQEALEKHCPYVVSMMIDGQPKFEGLHPRSKYTINSQVVHCMATYGKKAGIRLHPACVGGYSFERVKYEKSAYYPVYRVHITTLDGEKSIREVSYFESLDGMMSEVHGCLDETRVEYIEPLSALFLPRSYVKDVTILSHVIKQMGDLSQGIVNPEEKSQ